MKSISEVLSQEGLLTSAQAAAFLGLSYSAFRKIHQQIPSSQLVPRGARFYKLDDLFAYQQDAPAPLFKDKDE